MKRRILTGIVLVLLLAGKAMAQDDDERGDKVEALKIAFFTEKLDLSSSEAKAFWPVFNDFSKELKKIREKEKESMMTFSAKASPTDQECSKFVSDHIASRQAQLDLTKRYVAEFKKVLPERKVARLLTIEQEFKQQLLQRLKERKGRMQR